MLHLAELAHAQGHLYDVLIGPIAGHALQRHARDRVRRHVSNNFSTLPLCASVILGGTVSAAQTGAPDDASGVATSANLCSEPPLGSFPGVGQPNRGHAIRRS